MNTKKQETNFEKLCTRVFDIIHEETTEYLTEEMGFIDWSETYHNLQGNVMCIVSLT
jgi:hypothetical protein